MVWVEDLRAWVLNCMATRGNSAIANSTDHCMLMVGQAPRHQNTIALQKDSLIHRLRPYMRVVRAFTSSKGAPLLTKTTPLLASHGDLVCLNAVSASTA